MAAVYPPPPPPYSQYNNQNSQPPPVFSQYNTQYIQQPPAQQSTTVVLAQPAMTAPRAFGSCPYCGGYLRKQHSVCGIIVAILFFPLGIICCFMMMETRCVSCRR